MVSRESFEQDGGLVDELRVELVVAKTGKGACSADSARARFGSRAMVAASIPVTSAAIAT